ncbi:MAG: hypothetical protein K6E29_09675 [Cyanobacteria bacterium RUI128]|nr:hypothetical protein [Cyanobacteria bacterium RUI128]
MIDKTKVAVVLLAYADFEALEISLAAISKTIHEGFTLYILQNGRNTYDCERTYRVAKRYEGLYPANIRVVDWIQPGYAYNSIKTLLDGPVMKNFDYICKIDDDVFPLRNDWLDKLITCYEKSQEKYGDNLGYVTGLINNNPWGFKETLEVCGLEKEYVKNIGRLHVAGSEHDISEPEIFLGKDEIYTGCCGTIWRNPYISRWLHEKTSLQPQKFISKTKNLGYKEVDETKRYSINVIFFKKELWNDIDIGFSDDEHMFREYCKNNNKKIVADLSDPFVHLCFFTQREENRDLMPKFREVYGKWLKLPFPISICPDKEYENENRLRFLECKIDMLAMKR